MINGSKQKDHNIFLRAEEQLAFNNQASRGGIPTTTLNFLVFCAERMMNITLFELENDSICNMT